MARIQTLQAPPPDPAAINLTRLLNHLNDALLSTNADPQLRRSSFARAKVGANLEYARSLLLRLEHDSTNIKVQSRKQATQTDLQAKRELIKQLNQRLSELNQLDDTEDEEESEDEDDTNQPSYAPAITNTSSSIDTEYAQTSGNPQLQAAAANLTSTIRSRHPKPADATPDKGTASGASLFPSSGNTGENSDVQHTETMLDHNRREQDSITDSLIAMAQALKNSSLQFHQTLENEDKEVLEKAMQGLDKNATGIEAASRRMGALRRMTEGKGWFGRLSLWARVVVLWFTVIFIVFVMPKLRF